MIQLTNLQHAILAYAVGISMLAGYALRVMWCCRARARKCDASQKEA